MKKFDIYVSSDGYYGQINHLVKEASSDGDWVKADLAEEMLEVLKEANAFMQKQKWSAEEMMLTTKIQSIIAKAEAE